MELAKIKQLLLFLSPSYVNNTLATTKLFFVVSLGRSGTSFLSRLLSLTQERDVAVFHELNSDRKALVEAYHNSGKAKEYLKGYRGRVVAARIIQSNCKIYGEVNSYLRYHVQPIRELWNPLILHLVRDGRSVVRSIMNRKTFLPSDRVHSGKLAPLPNDPWADKWPSMSRFERVCWYWATTNRYLLIYNLPLVRFEEITHSYELFEKQILTPIGINIPSKKWEEQIHIPQNENQHNWFPQWDNWSALQQKQFEAICGDVMLELGYTCR